MNCAIPGNAAIRDFYFRIDLSTVAGSEAIMTRFGKIEKEGSLLGRALIFSRLKVSGAEPVCNIIRSAVENAREPFDTEMSKNF